LPGAASRRVAAEPEIAEIVEGYLEKQQMDTSMIPAVATSVLRETLRGFDDGDRVSIDTLRHGVRVAYISTLASRDDGDVTHLKCQLDFETGQMWVDDVRVARSLRCNGIGRQLVAAAEGIASVFGLQSVNVFPLLSAEHFWKKMGYATHPRKARVVRKEIPKDRPVLPASRDILLKSPASKPLSGKPLWPGQNNLDK